MAQQTELSVGAYPGPVHTFAAKTEVAVIVPTAEGPEYTVPGARLHFTVPEERLHYTVPNKDDN